MMCPAKAPETQTGKMKLYGKCMANKRGGWVFQEKGRGDERIATRPTLIKRAIPIILKTQAKFFERDTQGRTISASRPETTSQFCPVQVIVSGITPSLDH